MSGKKATNEIPVDSRSSWEDLPKLKVGWEKCDNGDTGRVLWKNIKEND